DQLLCDVVTNGRCKTGQRAAGVVELCLRRQVRETCSSEDVGQNPFATENLVAQTAKRIPRRHAGNRRNLETARCGNERGRGINSWFELGWLNVSKLAQIAVDHQARSDSNGNLADDVSRRVVGADDEASRPFDISARSLPKRRGRGQHARRSDTD